MVVALPADRFVVAEVVVSVDPGVAVVVVVVGRADRDVAAEVVASVDPGVAVAPVVA